MYTALYRKYRPATFDEMVGQEHIVKILKNQIETGNIAHAYLFCGTRGTGKTSAARIFAKGVNCLSESGRPCGECENCQSIQQGIFFDVIEIDAASNNRVENIRELRESVKYPPAAGLCKVYIIDEVHMLSTSAFNALLKTLEEPPEHVIFILATTEPHKLPATILSRCLRLDFRRVPEVHIKNKLAEICDNEGIRYEDSAVAIIAANGDGSVRDSLSILEQCVAAGDKVLTRDNVIDILGIAGEEIFIELTDNVINKDTASAFSTIEKVARDGKDMKQFIKDWIYHFRNLMMTQFADKLEDIIDMSCENAEKLKEQGSRIDVGFISTAISELSAVSNKARYSTQPRTLLELAIMKLSVPALNEAPEAVIQRIEYLERKIAELENGVSVNAHIIEEKNSEKILQQKKAVENIKQEKPAAKPKKIETEEAKPVIQEDVPPWDDIPEDIMSGADAQQSIDIPMGMDNDMPPWDEGYIENLINAASEQIEAEEGADSVIAKAEPEEPKHEEAAQSEPEYEPETQDEPAEDEAETEDMPEEMHDRDNEGLWNAVIERASREIPMLKVFRNNVTVLSADGRQMLLKADSKLAKNMIEQKAESLEKYVYQISGEPMKIAVTLNGSAPAPVKPAKKKAPVKPAPKKTPEKTEAAPESARKPEPVKAAEAKPTEDMEGAIEKLGEIFGDRFTVSE